MKAQDYHDKLEKWSGEEKKKINQFSKSKCGVLHLRYCTEIMNHTDRR